ncbi:unnamed protein product [Closterium sp. NIES-64]|nr:unnamed protein product [Closterium sp. NIES-64]
MTLRLIILPSYHPHLACRRSVATSPPHLPTPTPPTLPHSHHPPLTRPHPSAQPRPPLPPTPLPSLLFFPPFLLHIFPLRPFIPSPEVSGRIILRSGLKCAGVQAGSRWEFKEGMGKAAPRLLETMMKVDVVTPEDHSSDVIGELNSPRGQVNNFVDKLGGMKVSRGEREREEGMRRRGEG